MYQCNSASIHKNHAHLLKKEEKSENIEKKGRKKRKKRKKKKEKKRKKKEILVKLMAYPDK